MPARKPAARPSAAQEDGAEQYAATAWGGGSSSIGEDLVVPSGQRCLVRKPGVETLIKAGVLHSVDGLTNLVDELVDRAENRGPKKPSDHQKKNAKTETTPVDIKSIITDPNKFAQMTHLIDRVVCFTVLKPEVHMTPNDVTSRKNGVIYADMIDFEDKTFIFNYAVGGSADIAQFRKESRELVGDLSDGLEDEEEAE